MLDPFAGELIATTGGLPRLTCTDSLFDPNAPVHVTVIVFDPRLSVTEFVFASLEATLFTVHVVPPGMVLEPLTVKATLTDDAVVLKPSEGEVIATADGGLPVTLMLAGVPLPNWLAQLTVIGLLPTERLTVFELALLLELPLTVQVVFAGIEGLPPTVYATLTVAEVVENPFAGELIATTGTLPRFTVTEALAALPAESVQLTVSVFAPTFSGRLEPLAGVQVGVPRLSLAV